MDGGKTGEETSEERDLIMRKFDRGDFMNALLYVPTALLPLLGAASLPLDLHLLCWFLMALAVAWMPGYFVVVWLYQPALMAWVNADDEEANQRVLEYEATERSRS